MHMEIIKPLQKSLLSKLLTRFFQAVSSGPCQESTSGGVTSLSGLLGTILLDPPFSFSKNGLFHYIKER